MSQIPYLNESFISQNNDYNTLTGVIKEGFASDGLVTPPRHHHEYTMRDMLLLMPAWQSGKDLGVKIISTNPNNAEYNLPTINGLYVYMDIQTGVPLALLDAKPLTAFRTAATSAMAASLLARSDRKSMLMIGTGALAPELIKAHSAVSSIDSVYIWGRDYIKAELLVKDIEQSLQGVSIRAVRSIADVAYQVDLISTATYSQEPLVKSEHVTAGCHIDLVGSYKVDMRETDSSLMKLASIFVDSYEGALESTGDLVIPISEGVISVEDVKADLFELCRELKKGRSSRDEITLFKSVGHGLEDLVAARYFYTLFKRNS